MLIGIFSDSHNHADKVAAAITLLRARGATFFFHCGDVGEIHVLDHLAGLPSAFVWGNCDFDRAGLVRYGESIGVQCFGAFGEIELDEKRFALIHGDDARLKSRLIAEQRHDYLLQGHTHIPDDQRVGSVRIINPGALHRANPKTAALLDTASDKLVFLTIP